MRSSSLRYAELNYGHEDSQPPLLRPALTCLMLAADGHPVFLSCSSVIGNPAGTCGPRLFSRIKRFTIRSSSEWKLMIESRPPGASTLSELFSACSISSSSLFTQMRTALEGTSRGMFKLIFHRRCSSHDFRQFFGAGHRLFAVTLDNGAGNAFGKTLFTIGFQYPGRYRLLLRFVAIQRLTAHGLGPYACPADHRA